MTTTTDTNSTQVLVPGATVHLLRGSKYAGEWKLTEVSPAEGYPGWFFIRADRGQWFTQPADAFATEAEARAEGRARRQPRRAKVQPVVAGEWGMACQLGMIGTRR
jgi:hypothetical protein